MKLIPLLKRLENVENTGKAMEYDSEKAITLTRMTADTNAIGLARLGLTEGKIVAGRRKKLHRSPSIRDYIYLWSASSSSAGVSWCFS